MRKTLNAMAAAISGQTDPRMKEIFFYLNHMANEVDPDGKNYCDKFKTAHTATAADEAKYPGVTEGDFIWKTNEGQPNEHLYDWTHPITTGAFGDRFMVGLCVGAQGIPSMEKIVSGLNDLLKLYKVNTLQDLLLKFKKDPMFAILLWIMTYHDQNAQANMSGANNQSQVVSKILTDKYANGLQRLASSAGKWSASGEDFMKLAPEMKGIADNWAENVTGPIGNIKVTYTDRDGNKAEASLKDYLNMPDPGPDSKKDILNRALSPNPSGEQPNPNYQVLTQATTTGAQLANGQSKNITTQLSTLATLESAIDKTLDQIVNPTNGLMSMMKYFVNQQRAT
jgi:hypothetical protein